MERGMGGVATDDAVESREVVIEVVKGMGSENGSAGGICKNGRERWRGNDELRTTTPNRPTIGEKL
jgi:hypothetical protein